jgi:hypothetical protein
MKVIKKYWKSDYFKLFLANNVHLVFVKSKMEDCK